MCSPRVTRNLFALKLFKWDPINCSFNLGVVSPPVSQRAMRTRLAPLIVVKQEPNDELLLGSSATVDDNNNKSFTVNPSSSSDFHSQSTILLHGESVVGIGGSGGGGGCPSAGSNQSYLHYADSNNNNKSCEVTRNQFGVAEEQADHFRSALVDGIKVEKCMFATNDRNNNNPGWFSADNVQVKREEEEENNSRNRQGATHGRSNSSCEADSADRKSMYRDQLTPWEKSSKRILWLILRKEWPRK